MAINHRRSTSRPGPIADPIQMNIVQSDLHIANVPRMNTEARARLSQAMERVADAAKISGLSFDGAVGKLSDWSEVVRASDLDAVPLGDHDWRRLGGGGGGFGLAIQSLQVPMGPDNVTLRATQQLLEAEQDRVRRMVKQAKDTKKELDDLKMILVSMGVDVRLPRVISAPRKMRLR